MHLRKAFPLSREHLPSKIYRTGRSIGRFSKCIQSDGGDSPPIVAVHRWVVAVRRRGGEEEEEKEVEVEVEWRRVLRGLWTRSIMHLLAGVVPLSHRRAIAPARRYSSL